MALVGHARATLSTREPTQRGSRPAWEHPVRVMQLALVGCRRGLDFYNIWQKQRTILITQHVCQNPCMKRNQSQIRATKSIPRFSAATPPKLATKSSGTMKMKKNGQEFPVQSKSIKFWNLANTQLQESRKRHWREEMETVLPCTCAHTPYEIPWTNCPLNQTKLPTESDKHPHQCSPETEKSKMCDPYEHKRPLLVTP